MTTVLVSRIRGIARKTSAPLLSQGVTAGTSLLLQVLAARALGLTEFGAFTLFLGLLVSASALYTGWVGDSLAVLDRNDREIRAALATSALGSWALWFAVGCGTALVIRDGELLTAVVYAAMLVCWLAEETVRRLLIARLEFWRLVGNDVSYLVGTVLALGLFAGVGNITLTTLLAAMTAGASTAVVVGVVQLPGHELHRLRPGLTAMRSVASFAAWRSMQATLRPAALLAARVLVSAFLSMTALGLLEAGRLVVAPLQVVINGAGSFLLAGFAAEQRRGGSTVRAHRAVWALVITTAAGGAALALFAHPVGRLVTGYATDPALVLGWVGYLAVWAAGLPYVAELVARRMSREVFLIRLVDSLLGLGLVALVLAWGGSLVAVPWLMAGGGVYSAWRLRRLALRSRSEQAAQRTPVGAG